MNRGVTGRVIIDDEAASLHRATEALRNTMGVRAARPSAVSVAWQKSDARCDRTGCSAEALFHVVLLLRGKKGGPELRAATGLFVCMDHQLKTPDPFLSPERWLQLLEQFDRAGLERPKRNLTRVVFDPLPRGVSSAGV